jgi:GTP cyclohydrolase FolE2
MPALGDSKDVSEEQPDFKIPVWVMLRGRDIYLNVKNPFPSNGNILTNVLCSLELGLFLPSDRKGIHVSRIEGRIFDLSSESYRSIKEFTENLAKEIVKDQPAEGSKVILSGVFLRNTRTPESNIETHQRIAVKYSTTLIDGIARNELEIRLPVFIACPSCMKTLQSFDKSVGYATHSQKAFVTIKMDDMDDELEPDNIVSAMEKVSTVISHLLKRSDEGHIVLKTLKKPQYVEDLSRELLMALYKMYNGKIHDDANITVMVDSQESIHPHDIGAKISMKISDISHTLGA